MTRRLKLFLLFVFVSVIVGTALESFAKSPVEDFAQKYVEYLVQRNPVWGTSIGIHTFDGKLPDYSPESWTTAVASLRDFDRRLSAIDASTLSKDDQIDRRILTNHIRLQIFEIEELKEQEDPRTFTDTLGDGLSQLLLRDYAPIEKRLASVQSRCAGIPQFLEQAKAVLGPDSVQPSKVMKDLAVGAVEGMLEKESLLKKGIPEAVASSKLSGSAKAEVLATCKSANDSLVAFEKWIKETVVPRPDGEWRLGDEKYRQKYALYMDYPLDPTQLLNVAEQSMEETWQKFVELGRKIHDGYLKEDLAANKVKPEKSLSDRQVLADMFSKLAEDSSTAETVIPDSYALANLIRGFVQKKGLMTLPDSAKLKIQDVPPHMRGQAVAQIDTAPPFQPELDSIWFFDLSLLKSMPGYFKEYSRPMLGEVYIHEGVPGHFVQLWYSNKFPRITPKVFGNNAMIEGWAMFIQQEMAEEGFTVYPDKPYGKEIQRLANYKSILRGTINCVIDIKLHTTDWSEEEALKLMREKGLQEEAEAIGKIGRVKHSNVQLTTYFAGYHGILEILEEYQKKMGSEFRLKDFNERLVSAGSPPFYVLRDKMLAQ